MTLVFKVRTFSAADAKLNHRELSDVNDLGLSEEQYITGEMLSEELRMPRETILQILDKRKVSPIAKIVARGEVTAEHPLGKPKGGRPKLAFDPEIAKTAIIKEIEQRYSE